ncbi:MAG: hypothetical protein AAB472_01720 [Patescibacteria group bacterium]
MSVTAIAERFLNDKPFEHRCHNGTIFRADRSDFVGGVDVYFPARLCEMKRLQDVAEMTYFHTQNIIPRLNGYMGIGVEYRIHRV